MSKNRTQTLRVKPWDAPYLLVLLAGWAMGLYHASHGMHHLALISAGMATLGVWVIGFQRVPAVARRSVSGLEGLAALPVPVAAGSVRILATEGECAWGYRKGDRWRIGKDSSVSPPLCRTAIAAIFPMMRLPEGAWGGAARAVCNCPLAGCRAFFGLSWGGE